MAGGNTADDLLRKSVGGLLWRINALLLANAVLTGIIVGIGAYTKRYRYHPFIRFIFLGATTLFLPIISSVISRLSGTRYYSYYYCDDNLIAKCDEQEDHMLLVIIWAFLIHIAVINTCTVVAGDDREGRNIGLPLQLLVQGAWTFYLAVTSTFSVAELLVIFQYAPFALVCSKLVSKYYAFEKAKRSVAFGRNPRLISGYMQQLQLNEASQSPVVGEDPPPPLLVMGEDGRQVEKQPYGYVFKDNIGLVTIDRVCQYEDRVLLASRTKDDLCLSFALFKLLRCRFARYKLSKVGSMGTLSFLWNLLLKDGERNRIFQLVADELSFVHDYYYSSLPISFSKWWLPILNISISLLTLGYCVYVVIVIGQFGDFVTPQSQTRCFIKGKDGNFTLGASFGNLYIDVVAACLLIVLVMVSEGRDVASYICSNWTKVALICYFVNHATSQYPLCMRKCVGILLRYRCKLMKHWDQKIGQCTVLVLHQSRTTQCAPLMHLLCFPNSNKVKVPDAVKLCIISALRSSRNGSLSHGTSSLSQSQAGERLLWACNGKGTSDTILVWHIATCILEVSCAYQQANQGSPPNNLDSDDHKITATHLSRYCVYLMNWLPELLPDDDGWSKGLYEAVKKDADRVLAGHTVAAGPSSTLEAECQQLVQLLGEGSKHEVLKNGVKLGKQLVELEEGEEEAWKLLGGLWSEMILYVAPSDNLNGHSEAIARGGELITVLWTLLFHVGIFSRLDEGDGATAAAAGV